jgi:hypothetical protein
VKSIIVDWWVSKLMYEIFANNPYGLGADFYSIAGLAILAVLYGNFILAVIKGYQAESWLMFFKCLVNGLVIFWSFPFFLHPVLIANVQQIVETIMALTTLPSTVNNQCKPNSSLTSLNALPSVTRFLTACCATSSNVILH